MYHSPLVALKECDLWPTSTLGCCNFFSHIGKICSKGKGGGCIFFECWLPFYHLLLFIKKGHVVFLPILKVIHSISACLPVLTNIYYFEGILHYYHILSFNFVNFR